MGNRQSNRYIVRVETFGEKIWTFKCSDIQKARIVFMRNIRTLFPNKKEVPWSNSMLEAYNLFDLPENQGKFIIRCSITDKKGNFILANQYLVDCEDVISDLDSLGIERLMDIIISSGMKTLSKEATKMIEKALSEVSKN